MKILFQFNFLSLIFNSLPRLQPQKIRRTFHAQGGSKYKVLFILTSCGWGYSIYPGHSSLEWTGVYYGGLSNMAMSLSAAVIALCSWTFDGSTQVPDNLCQTSGPGARHPLLSFIDSAWLEPTFASLDEWLLWWGGDSSLGFHWHHPWKGKERRLTATRQVAVMFTVTLSCGRACSCLLLMKILALTHSS